MLQMRKAKRIKTFARTDTRFFEKYGYHLMNSPNAGRDAEQAEIDDWNAIFEEELQHENTAPAFENTAPAEK